MSVDNVKKNIILTPFNLLYKISPSLTLKILFRIKLGYSLNLSNPKTYMKSFSGLSYTIEIP